MSCSEIFGDDTLSLQTAGGFIVKVKSIEGPTFSGSDQGHQATWSILIQASDLTYLINGLFPPAVIVQSAFGNISVKPPNQLLPSSGFFYATNYSAKPFKREIGDPFFSDPKFTLNNSEWLQTYSSIYRVDITFSTKTDGRQDGSDQEDPNDISSIIDDAQSVDVGGEFLRIGDNSLKWGPDNEPNDELAVGVTQTVPHILHTLSRSRVLNPDFAAIANILGHVNEEAATLQNMGIIAEPECLMAIGASGNRVGGWGGQAEWDMQYKFAQREFLDEDFNTITWNHFYRPSRSQWQKLKIAGRNGDLRDVYVKADLKDIFKSR